MSRKDVRDEPGRCMRLSAEEGVETWLDLMTGRVLVGLSRRETDMNTPSTETTLAEASVSDSVALLDVVKDYLDEAGYTYLVVSPENIGFPIEETHALYNILINVD